MNNKLVFLQGFNDYYNRKVRRKNSVLQYVGASTGSVTLESVENFTPGDGINTKQIVNLTYLDEIEPNYLLVCDDEDNIVSRWFVLDSVRVRWAQTECKLKRDVLVDYYSDILDAHTFIDRATLPNTYTNPLIFNRENSSYNQILQSETLLKDSTNTPWIVGYVANNLSTAQLEHKVNINTFDLQYESWEDFPFNAVTKTESNIPKNMMAEVVNKRIVIQGYNNTDQNSFIFDQDGTDDSSSTPNPGITLRLWDGTTNVGIALNQMRTAINHKTFYGNTIWDLIDLDSPDIIIDPNRIADVSALNNKIIRIGTDGNYIFKKLRYKTYTETSARTFSIPSNHTLESALDQIATSAVGVLLQNENQHDSYSIGGKVKYGYLDLENVSAAYYSVNFGSVHNTLTNQPYSIFAIPYNDTTINGQACDKDASRKMAAQIATDLGGTGTSFLYDIQIVPFAPSIHTTQGKVEGRDFSYIKDTSNTIKSIIFWQTSDSGEFTWNTTYTPTNWKQSSETEMWRIVSPNYNGMFEFSPAKNYGVSGIKAEWTYKPGTPYIKIAPIFKGLYSSANLMNNGAVGCICGGDFSMAVIDDAWTDYTISNKNFQNIFDRQMQTLDLNNKWSDITEPIAAVFNAAGTGAGIGFATGSKKAGLITGAASLGVGLFDAYVSKEIRDDNRKLQDDMFNFQKGNTQALPNSLAKVGAQNANFRYWPVLEKYDCTSKEKQILADNLKWMGMTIGCPGTIREYVSDEARFTNGEQFIQGRLIRLDTIDCNTDLLQEINAELQRGWYYIWQ